MTSWDGLTVTAATVTLHLVVDPGPAGVRSIGSPATVPSSITIVARLATASRGRSPRSRRARRGTSAPIHDSTTDPPDTQCGQLLPRRPRRLVDEDSTVHRTRRSGIQRSTSVPSPNDSTTPINPTVTAFTPAATGNGRSANAKPMSTGPCSTATDLPDVLQVPELDRAAAPDPTPQRRSRSWFCAINSPCSNAARHARG